MSAKAPTIVTRRESRAEVGEMEDCILLNMTDGGTMKQYRLPPEGAMQLGQVLYQSGSRVQIRVNQKKGDNHDTATIKR